MGASLRGQSEELARVAEELIVSRLPGAKLLGVGREELHAAFERLDRSVRRSVWNIQRTATYGTVRRFHDIDVADRTRGVESRYIVPGFVLRDNPMILCLAPHVRVAPVFTRFIVLDGGPVVVPGPPAVSGEYTAWLVDDPYVCAVAHRLWNETWAVSTPGADEAGMVVLTERQRTILKEMADGATDAAIARRLHVSQRTLTADVARILEAAGARSRAQMMATFNG